MRRSNLLAVEVGKESDSMEPLISPYDIVLVDRDDFVPQQDGRGIYLVREPGQLGGGMIKRVQVHRVKGETQVVFYSDNKKYGPEPPRFLDADYGEEWKNAIVGRCVWSWSDLTRK
jgi:phage repressor protein C with HTH and peptisase S24 domain